jgi:hypothetical protein
LGGKEKEVTLRQLAIIGSRLKRSKQSGQAFGTWMSIETVTPMARLKPPAGEERSLG